ncbi:MAG: M55 family metallopeptidase [Oscillospiraceae bacterium]|nr:M55 family metallopeptidase [Oscillospiraceae bacterium]
MRIAIMTDMEGVAGVINFNDWTFLESPYYEQGKILLTEEVNAAIRGFFDAGANEIFVIDGHGAGAINSSLLDERALYSRGWARYHEFGLSQGFDAYAFVGQHAKAGTKLSHLAHTGDPHVLEIRVNGISVGEYGQCAFIAGFYGTPVIFASGERAFCEEALALTPFVHTAETKYGVTLDNGKDCTAEEYWTHNLGAVHVHPNVARKRIYEGAKSALEEYIKNPEKFKPVCPEPPFVWECWLRKNKDTPACKQIRRHDSDILEMFSAKPEVLHEGEYSLPY